MNKLFFRGFQIFLIIAVLGIPGLRSFNEGSLVKLYNPKLQLGINPVLTWNTFLGSASSDSCGDVAMDASGNVYVVGTSESTWGTPISAHVGGDDVFVAKLNSSGILQWHTFMGSASDDNGGDIILDESGNIYITGAGGASWGSPVIPHTDGDDAFAAKLNSSGVLQWNTFMGGLDDVYIDMGIDIIVDDSGNVYVVGLSGSTWGTPVNPYSGSAEAFVAKLNSSGVRQWNTFIGTTNNDWGVNIALDGGGNLYVTGFSGATWGTPINPHAGGDDAFVAKLNNSGVMQWNTFMGSASHDWGMDIAIDVGGNLYVSGFAGATWGSPVNPHAGGNDAFVVKLNSSGALQWHTFMGGKTDSYGNNIAVDTNGNIYVGGTSGSTWGSPVNPYVGGDEAFATRLNSLGVRQWHTFMGSSDRDVCRGITLDENGILYVVGGSESTWGTPINPHAGNDDTFITKHIILLPELDIKANGSDGPIVITQGDALSVIVDLDSGGLNGEDADWWVLMKTSDPKPNNLYYFDVPTRSWMLGRSATRQGSLFNVTSKKVPKTSGLAPGTFTFYFAVDMVMNGSIDVGQAFYDKVKVTINP